MRNVSEKNSFHVNGLVNAPIIFKVELERALNVAGLERVDEDLRTRELQNLRLRCEINAQVFPDEDDTSLFPPNAVFEEEDVAMEDNDEELAAGKHHGGL